MEAILLTNIGSLELGVDLEAAANTTRDTLVVCRELHWVQGIRIGVFDLA